MKTKTILLFMLLAMFIHFGKTHAQQNNQIESLGDILNQTNDNFNENLSAEERGNIYFDTCMQTNSLAFDKEEKELLCACTSAKLGDFITAKEFAQLNKDTKKGEQARMKLITYGYIDCMNYAIKEKVYKDCRVLPRTKSVRYGKDKLCKCAVKHFNSFLSKSASYLIMEGVKYDPMTLNPLEHYFTTDAYYDLITLYTKHCRSQMLYNKNN